MRWRGRTACMSTYGVDGTDVDVNLGIVVCSTTW